ncbi:MAG: hypothetical protein NC517_08965 [Firmicutes bacterium]|nr:hypothetical protein [Bacillota bacterium]
MSEVSERFLKVKTYEEYNQRRHEFKGLKITDPGVREHLEELNPPEADPGVVDGRIIDAFIRKKKTDD